MAFSAQMIFDLGRPKPDSAHQAVAQTAVVLNSVLFSMVTSGNVTRQCYYNRLNGWWPEVALNV